MLIKTIIAYALFTSALVIGLETNVYAQSFSLNQVNEHILKIRSLKESVASLNLDEEKSKKILLRLLRRSDNYAQALTEYLIKDYQDGGVDPYSLNLVHEFLSYQIMLHKKISNLTFQRENLLLKSLQLVTIKKINDLFFSNKGLRAIYKDQLDDESFHLILWKKMIKRFFTKSYINSLNQLVKEKYYPINQVNLDSLDKLNKAIVLSFRDSRLYNDILKSKQWHNTLQESRFWTNFSDNTTHAFSAVTTGISATFGAIAGNIAWREGYLKDDKILLETLKRKVKPFDLLMEKKAYKLTDLTIPGHWGHVGVYLGTKEQLQELGLWELPALGPFRESIERGKSIFQVRRTGLEFDSLEHFTNLDEMAVLRVEGQIEKSKDELKLVFEYLSDQLGKSYDFSFDAMTAKKITCTEIVAFSYGPIKWPMEYILGRYTVSPNNMAELTFFTGSPVKNIMYITGDKQEAHYLSVEEFGKTLDYKSFGAIYKKDSVDCQRKTYRHNRSSIRFKYECKKNYSENKYETSL